jgi:hypothetical protein
MRALPLPLVLAVAAALAACDTAVLQNDFRIAALSVPQGFTRTDASGGVVGTADPDDWRSAPIYGPAAVTSVDVAPIYPNPASGVVTLVVNVRSGTIVGGLRVVGYVERPGQLPQTFTLADEPDGRGPVIVLTISLASHPGFTQGGGLRRLVLFDGQGDVISYGDLMVE